MAPRCGKKADTPSSPVDRALHAMGRLVGFGLLAGLGVGILACVVLIPPYARVLEAAYERDCNAALNADYQANLDAQDLLIRDFQSDEVLVRRLASSTLGVLPPGQEASPALGEPQPMPAEVITISPHSRPEPPNGWVMRVAERVRDVPNRRGLCLLAAAAIVAAMLLFSNPLKYIASRRDAEAGSDSAAANP